MCLPIGQGSVDVLHAARVASRGRRWRPGSCQNPGQQGLLLDASPCFPGVSNDVQRSGEELLPDILDGRFESGRVFGRVVRLDEVPDGYRAMNDREAIKVMIEPCGALL